MDNAILYVFRFLKRDSGYKIPKYLMILQSILKYIYKKEVNYDIDYTYFSTLLESENVTENLMFLLDYGIPSNTLKKIQGKIPSDIKTKEEIILKIKNIINDDNNELTKYEMIILEKI